MIFATMFHIVFRDLIMILTILHLLFIKESQAGILEKVASKIIPKKCIGDLGCFDCKPPYYHPIFRPICVLPHDNINATLRIFTQEGEQTTLNPNLPTKVLIQGFQSNMDGPLLNITRNPVVDGGDFNVVIVDWSKHNKPPYPQAVANARAVAVQVANFLTKSGVDPKTIHILGVSLGAHIAGGIGARIPNIGRITGLDPAGPFYQKAENEVKLDKSDATYVDVIHTNSGECGDLLQGFGLGEPIGHVDFYPNGGLFQPGCEKFIGLEKGFCSHVESFFILADTIQHKDHHCIGVKCSSYIDFQSGLCNPENSPTAKMGFFEKNNPEELQPGKYFLRTNNKEPYCNK